MQKVAHLDRDVDHVRHRETGLAKVLGPLRDADEVRADVVVIDRAHAVHNEVRHHDMATISHAVATVAEQSSLLVQRDVMGDFKALDQFVLAR